MSTATLAAQRSFVQMQKTGLERQLNEELDRHRDLKRKLAVSKRNIDRINGEILLAEDSIASITRDLENPPVSAYALNR